MWYLIVSIPGLCILTYFENSAMGLLRSLLENERQKAYTRLRPGRNIARGPIVRRGWATTSEVLGEALARC